MIKDGTKHQSPHVPSPRHRSHNSPNDSFEGTMHMRNSRSPYESSKNMSRMMWVNDHKTISLLVYFIFPSLFSGRWGEGMGGKGETGKVRHNDIHTPHEKSKCSKHVTHDVSQRPQDNFTLGLLLFFPS
jgi:hypothetical protein